MHLQVFRFFSPRVSLKACAVSLLVVSCSAVWCASAFGAPARDKSHDLARDKTRDVARCLTALSRAVGQSKEYDRLLHLDRDVLRARLRKAKGAKAIFSIAEPVRVQGTVTMRGSARRRGHWQWQPVLTQCGIRDGRVVATSIQPLVTPGAQGRRERSHGDEGRSGVKPTEKSPREYHPRPGSNYVALPSAPSAAYST